MKKLDGTILEAAMKKVTEEGNMAPLCKDFVSLLDRNLQLESWQIVGILRAFCADYGDVVKQAKVEGLKIGVADKDFFSKMRPVLEQRKQFLTRSIQLIKFCQDLDKIRKYALAGKIPVSELLPHLKDWLKETSLDPEKESAPVKKAA